MSSENSEANSSMHDKDLVIISHMKYVSRPAYLSEFLQTARQ